MISIVIPLYDKAAQIAETLSSVRLQDFTAYELVIVDDGSTDGSLDIVRDYCRQYKEFAIRVRLFSQQHAGVSAARNKGIHESRYEWIAFLDADDRWTSDYLRTQYELSLKYPFCEVLASGYGFNLGAGRLVPAKFSKIPFRGPDGVLDNYFVVASCSHPPLSSITTIVRKYAVEAIGCFPEGISSGEDLLTWARLAIDCRIAFTKKPMAVFNRDPAFFNSDQRKRMPDKNDRVGSFLKDLFRKYPGIVGIRSYLGAWHKMRARIFLSNSMKKEAWTEWKQLFLCNPVNYKTWAYLLMLVCPIKIVS